MGTEAQRQRNLKQAKDIEKYVEREKNQLLEKAKQLIFKKEDELNRKQETLQKLAEQKKRLELRVFRTEETVLQNILDLKHSYEESWKSSEIQEEMAIHRAPLKYLYDLLLKHQLAKAGSMNSAIGLSTVAFFAIGFRIVPIIIDKVTLALQFKFLVRHIETSSADTGLSFHAFE